MTRRPALYSVVFWRVCICSLAAAAGPGLIMPAVAQSSTSMSPPAQRVPDNAPYLSSTGETVPHIGASQSAGVTSLDRRVEERDDRIMNSICRDC